VTFYESRSSFQKLFRIIQAQKFYSNLRLKLDIEEQKIRDSYSDQPDVERIDHPPDGSIAQKLLGGAIQIRSKFFKSDDNRKI